VVCHLQSELVWQGQVHQDHVRLLFNVYWPQETGPRL
jgi:hypothetical protein